jgi:hypothetical protein
MLSAFACHGGRQPRRHQLAGLPCLPPFAINPHLSKRILPAPAAELARHLGDGIRRL